MVLYICLVAVVNLALGFVTAVYVARRYRQLVAVASHSAEAAVGPAALPTSQSGPGGPVPDAPNLPDTEEPPASTQAMPAVAPSAEQADLRQPPVADEEPPDSQTAAEDAFCAQAPASAPSQAPHEPSPGEACLQELKQQVEHYQQQLAHLDHALRDCGPEPEAGTIQLLADSLAQANQQYLESRHQVQQTLESLSAQGETLGDLGHNLQAAIQEQDVQIEHASAVIQSLDRQADAGQLCHRILNQTAKLLHANHHLRDILEETSAGLARSQQHLESMDLGRQTDQLTELANRMGLETALAQWWEKDPHRQRRLIAAMIDIDQFGQLNQRFGQAACDRILQATAELLRSESHGHSLAARFSGQRFVLLFADVDLQFAINVVECIRQTIQAARFRYNDDELRITASCGLVQATAEDTPDTLCARAEATLQEAKRYGRNRTFVHEGEYPTPVMPPSFTVTERTISV